jgi:phosphatidylserine/phosphatidylglycerophosphate/cardiolipin synthase-like enzyme
MTVDNRIILVPIDRYRVDYEVGTGTPFSRLDAIVLRAVANEPANSVAQLRRQLFLPERMLIESIVALSRAGWISVGGSDQEFGVTPLGCAALQQEILPTPERVMTRHGSVLVEALTGQVATIRDLTFWTAKRLQDHGLWARAERLPRSKTIRSLDSGRVKPLLPREQSEWIRWIGQPMPQQEAWLKLEVDPSGKRVVGLPDVWASSLLAKLGESLNLEGLSHKLESRKIERAKPADENPHQREWRVSTDDCELVASGAAHLEVIRRALREARSQVFVSSAFVSAEVIERHLAPLVIAATERGVRVDLLWGYSAGDTAQKQDRTLHALKELRKQCKGGHALRFNEVPAGSHAKLLAWDAPSGEIHACVGSNNWLSVPFDAYIRNHVEISVLTSNPGLVSDVCSTVAGLWSESQSVMSGTDDIWHRAASEMDRALTTDATGQAARESSSKIVGSTATPVRDRDHEEVIRKLLGSASHRVGICSHKVGPKGLVRLAPLRYWKGDIPMELLVVVGELVPGSDAVVQEISGLLEGVGSKLRLSAGAHAKVIVVDRTVLITSFNILSADPFENADGDREVGVLLTNSEISDAVWKWLSGLDQGHHG